MTPQRLKEIKTDLERGKFMTNGDAAHLVIEELIADGASEERRRIDRALSMLSTYRATARGYGHGMVTDAYLEALENALNGKWGGR